MNTIILRTMAPPIATIMVLFSLFILLRGHGDPGGGFIGGLIAASAMAIYAMGRSVGDTRRLLRVHPGVFAGSGVLLAAISGLISLPYGVPFLTGIWLPSYLFGTPGLFDIGVYFTVFGTLTGLALALEDEEEGL